MAIAKINLKSEKSQNTGTENKLDYKVVLNLRHQNNESRKCT